MQQYTKPHTTLEAQIEKLRQRGLIITNDEQAKRFLSNVGYYRLSSYCYRYERPPVNGERSHCFIEGATFDDIVKLYVFDQKLRVLVLEALERVEIATRSVWSHELSAVGGAHAHMDPKLFTEHEDYFKAFVTLIDEIKRSGKNSEEIAHYLNSYNEPFLPPIWMAVSAMSFGELFRWIKNTNDTKVKLAVAKHLGFANIQLFEGVTKPLTTIRNICAHHGRLWDTKLETKLPFIAKRLLIPMQGVQRKSGKEADNRMYNSIVIIAHILSQLTPDTSWRNRIATLISQQDPNVITAMGFPPDWESNPNWGLS